MSDALTFSISPNFYWRKIAIDSILVISAFCITYAASSYLNFSDNYFLWARQYEQTIDIDELPIALLVSLVAMLWFVKRRVYEAKQLILRNHALLQRILAVQEGERKRIAQDLHDDLGQYLNAIKVQATSLLVDASSSDDTLMVASRIALSADHAYNATRHMMSSLRPAALDELGLSAALEHLIDTWRPTQECLDQTRYTLHIDSNIDDFDEQVNIALFRIVQEALTNVAKHAKAKHVFVNIQSAKNYLTLIIGDDGVGFNTNSPAKGYGLLGIAERVETIGGQLLIESGPGIGTKVIVDIKKILKC